MEEKTRQLKRKKGPLMKDVAISAERLSLMIEFNNRGSLRSFERSINYLSRGSASKVDMLKSVQDVDNGRFSNLSVQLKNSAPNLKRRESIGKETDTEKKRVIGSWKIFFFSFVYHTNFNNLFFWFTSSYLKVRNQTSLQVP